MMNEYSIYERTNYAKVIEKLNKSKTQHVFVAMFGVGKHQRTIENFKDLLLNVANINSLCKDFGKNTRTAFNNTIILDISQTFSLDSKSLPELIFQSENLRESIVLKDYSVEQMSNIYQQKSENKCELCGRSLNRNKFIYYDKGKYYGKSCFEEKIMSASLIKECLTIFNCLLAIERLVDNDVIAFNKNDINKEYQPATLKARGMSLSENNEVLLKQCNNDASKLKEITKVAVEEMFNVNFISIPKREPLTPEKQKELITKQHFNFKEFLSYLIPKMRDAGYLKRIADFNNLFFKTFDMAFQIHGKDITKNKISELKALINDFNHVDSDNITLYTRTLSKMMPLINEGLENFSIRNKSTWFVSPRNKNFDEFKQVEKVEIGSKIIYVYERK